MIPCQSDNYKTSVLFSIVLNPNSAEGSLAVRSLQTPLKAT